MLVLAGAVDFVVVVVIVVSFEVAVVLSVVLAGADGAVPISRCQYECPV